MAVPSLKHYKAQVTTAGTYVDLTGAVAASRALVVSKITVANANNASIKVQLAISTSATTPTAGDYIAIDMTLAVGQVYTETGLVILAGERLIATCDVSGSARVNVFGEEVDN